MGYKLNKLICIHYLKYSVEGYYSTVSNILLADLDRLC